MWHVSIARVNQSGPIPTTRWGDGTRREAERRACTMIADVGNGPIIANETPAHICLHFRRSLSGAEIMMLTEEWLAIPARDEFGPDGVIEARL